MTTQQTAKVGVIGGTGLYEMDGLVHVREITIETPFGDPSDVITVGELDGTGIAFLPRHGRGHRFLPSEIPVRANIHAMKQLGVERLISISAVGSLQEHVAPLDMIVPDQLIDRTRLREHTFFGDGLVGHIAFGDPFCPVLSDLLATAADDTEAKVHRGGTYLVMEGPAFSTRAESRMHRTMGGDVVGMTAMPECRLAREAELAYALIALPTDYDCWKEDEAPVSWETVLKIFTENAGRVTDLLLNTIPEIPA